MLSPEFFNQDAIEVAKALLGKILCVKYRTLWMKAMIIETEAYYLDDKGSHASLGYTEKRKALFMPPGTIYMYYARGGDSLNVSCQGEGNAVLIKAGIPYTTQHTKPHMISVMQRLNPVKGTKKVRPIEKLCSGQTLLCKSLGLQVQKWDKRQFNKQEFYIKDVHYYPSRIIQTIRLGIPKGRDENLMYRFIDYNKAMYATNNPLSKRGWQENVEYFILKNTFHLSFKPGPTHEGN